jgi:hypothetical protein
MKKKISSFVEEPDWFLIITIGLHEAIQYVKTTYVETMDTSVKISNSKLKSKEHSIEKKITCNRYEPKVALEDKMYPKIYYNHQLGSVAVEENFTKIKTQEL